MADEGKKREDPIEEEFQDDESSEYGISQVLIANPEDLAEARKKSGYHYSGSELDHKVDRVDADETEEAES